ncbi:hypothetical protein HPB49_004572 [Dermacentor silvarum]|uniref:Uncharacterized protein n=1 Tax=Dermacentor silvarum TaxID=543639 RepID=A0ACB8CJI6_DERSI|nr:hypothetical protein HPB49_004572 [Dermacentor silvarum]
MELERLIQFRVLSACIRLCRSTGILGCAQILVPEFLCQLSRVARESVHGSLQMFLCFGSCLNWLDEGSKETPCVAAGNLSRGRVVQPVGVGEFGRILGRSLGELGNSSFKFSVMFLASSAADEAATGFAEL